MDSFFDCTNVRNLITEHQQKRKPFLAPYTSVDDNRFEWITNVIILYISIANHEGSFTASERGNMFISRQTHEGLQLQITCLSQIEVAKYLLTTVGCKCFLPERLNQDNYFSIQRPIGEHKENPTLFDFGYNDNAIYNSICTKSIMGNVAGNQIAVGDINIIDTPPVPCRKRRVED